LDAPAAVRYASKSTIVSLKAPLTSATDRMLKKTQFILLTGIALLSLVLVVADAVLFTQNRTLQTSFTGRQQFIQQTVQLEGLYQQMVKALAELSAKNKDDQLRSLLNAQGITFTLNQITPSAPAGNSTPKKQEK
jgi:hypothetical protein